MENLNAEQVKMALECCEHIQCQGEHCPYHPLDRCREQLRHDCYALIKELTEENEKLTVNMNAYGLTAKRLGEENERLQDLVKEVQEYNEAWVKDNHDLRAENERLRANGNN